MLSVKISKIKTFVQKQLLINWSMNPFDLCNFDMERIILSCRNKTISKAINDFREKNKPPPEPIQ